MRRLTTIHSYVTIFLTGLLSLSVLSQPALSNQPVSTLRQGLPGRRISGGSRSPNTACLATPTQPAIALIPESNLGLTLDTQPTLWFSLPAVNPERSLEFGLIDQSGEIIYQKVLDSSGEAGITSFSLPASAPSLDVDKDYRWYLSIICSEETDTRSEDLHVTGWIRRVQPDNAITQRLAAATLQERSAIYQELGLWYDALTASAELQHIDPNANHPEWSSLLNSINLPQVSTTPFVANLSAGSTITVSQQPQ